MKIVLTNVLVADQDRALRFYTEILGFVKKMEVPTGEYKWLTVAAPDGPSEVELLLEPMAFPPAQVYQKALFDAGIPYASFAIDDIAAEHERLLSLGVVFRTPPTKAGPVTLATFEDTCGNLIQMVQQ